MTNQSLEKIAYYDELTGLGNEQLLKHEYNKIDLAKVHFIFVDIDNFDKMNQLFGSVAINDLLVTVSKDLIDFCGNSDVYRVGPDQFMLLTKSHFICEPNELSKIMKKPITHHGIHYIVNASVCVLDKDQFALDSLDQIIQMMRFAINQSKQTKRNALIYADEELKNQFLEKIEIEENFFKSVKKGDFFPKYQPFVDTFSKEIIGFDTVSRWKLNGRELKPKQFLAIAEWTGLIFDIEHQMLQAAAEFFVELKNDKSIKFSKRFKMAVNFSKTTIKKIELKKMIECLHQHKIRPQDVIIGIKEEAINDLVVLEKVKDFHKAGFIMLVDEYNTSKSSVTSLALTNLDVLKLDEQLLQHIDNNQEYTRMHSVYKFLVDIGKRLNITIVSGGINSSENEKMVKDLNVQIGIGNYYTRAIIKEEFLKYMKDNSGR